ncbi:alpha beta-hydrolase [Lichtheimia corymbifera JMRC:FSU:9682]|uniref:GPI inositol-deacylase n=1 Tax=Lichtheimia corymbifera JMRC:FSU:9682 TaxID=1263082 RepID=A0A068RMT8_9FUNG|nr:alpha beta-hydrolase [Lichtheimia corymbifera JMRC:FSU:9682]
MVSISFSSLVDNLRHSLIGRPWMALLRPPRKIQPTQQATTVRVLYPRFLKNPTSGVILDRYDTPPLPSTTPSSAVTTHKPNNPIEWMPVTPHYRAPRAPIVLCHGLYGFDKWGPASFPMLQVRYWGGIEETLAKLGAKVIVTKVPRTGSVWERSQELHAILKAVLSGSKVNFVAHSMGGLDCRCLLSHIHNRPYHVQSLTTIATPHRGSPLMDWFRDHVGVGVRFATAAAAAAAAAATASSSSTTTSSEKRRYANYLLDPVIQMLDTPAYANLTTDYCQNHFNPSTPDDPKVAYYSYGADTHIPPWTLLGWTQQVVGEKEGPNDGIVSVASAKWGTYIKTLNANHWELNGQRPKWRSSIPSLSEKPFFDSSEFYVELADHLYQQGH